MKLEQLKTFEDACELLNLDHGHSDFGLFPEHKRETIKAMLMLFIIIRAANQIANNGKEWLPDLSNDNEYKCYPLFEINGSSFQHIGFDVWRTNSDISYRHCFISDEVGEYIVTKFIDLYKKMLAKS